MSDANDFLMGPRVVRFTARFDSSCEACDMWICEDDQAGFVGQEVCCDMCCDAAEGG